MPVKIMNLQCTNEELSKGEINEQAICEENKNAMASGVDYKWLCAIIICAFLGITAVIFKQNLMSLTVIIGLAVALIYKSKVFYIVEINDNGNEKLLNIIIHEIKSIKKNIVKIQDKDCTFNNIILLDTNVLYDSRIIDLVTDPVFKNLFCVPRFVLEELHRLYKTNEGKSEGERARNAINNFQLIMENNEIYVADIPRDESKDVDVQLVELAVRLGSSILTNDEGLQKLAIRKGVRVSSLKDLAESLEEPYGIGEVFTVKIIKRGKNKSEGVGYMRDGSMIVVDEAGDMIGQNIPVKIDTVNKGINGRIFFAAIHDLNS